MQNDFPKRLLLTTLRLSVTTLPATFTTLTTTFLKNFSCDFYDYYDYWIAWKLKNIGIRSVKKYDKIRRYLIRRRCSVI